jgi:hypothetical protein
MVEQMNESKNVPRATATVINFYEGAARSLGFASMAALEDATLDAFEAEMANDPQWQEYVRESALEAVKP